MPTLSQCQILNNLVQRRAVEDATPVVDADTEGIAAEHARTAAVVGHPRATTPQPIYHGVIYAEDNTRPVSVGGKVRNGESDHDVTPFQKQRMQMVANTTQILSAWRPRSLWTIEAAKIRSSSPIWNNRGNAYQRQNTYANLFPQENTVEQISSRAFYPWRRMASQKQMLILPVLEHITPEHPSERNGNLPTASSNTPVTAGGVTPENAGGLTPENAGGVTPENAGGVTPENAGGVTPENAGGVTPDNVSKSKPTVQFVEPKKEADIIEEDENKDDKDKTLVADEAENATAAVPNEKLFMKCSQDVKDQLYQLGWRKPEKKRKKIKKKVVEDTSKNPRLTYMTMPKLDLMKDPMLRKLAKKSKNVMVQAHPPVMRPKAVCFDIVGAHLTHVVVWKSFEKDILSEYDEVKVESIQFVPRSIFVPRQKNADPVENRWVITLDNEWYRSRVTGMEIHFGEFSTTLRRYDDVVNFEFRQYTRMSDMMKMIKPKKS